MIDECPSMRYHPSSCALRATFARLRDGTAVPHIPSYVQRRGRSFGWICETLEGAMNIAPAPEAMTAG